MCDHARYAPGCDDCRRDGDEVGAWEDLQAEVARLRADRDEWKASAQEWERGCLSAVDERDRLRAEVESLTREREEWDTAVQTALAGSGIQFVCAWCGMPAYSHEESRAHNAACKSAPAVKRAIAAEAERDAALRRARDIEAALVSRHGGEPLALLAELDAARSRLEEATRLLADPMPGKAEWERRLHAWLSASDPKEGA